MKCFGEEKMKTRQNKRMVKLDYLFIYLFKTTYFEHILKKSARSLLGAWSFLLVHIWFKPSEGPKGFVNFFLNNSDYQVGP